MSDEIEDVLAEGAQKLGAEVVPQLEERLPGILHETGDGLQSSADNYRNVEQDVTNTMRSPAGDLPKGDPVPEGGGSGGGAGGGGDGDPNPLNDGTPPTNESVPPGDKTSSDDPVDLATGEMFLAQVDLTLPGLLPLLLERVHLSNYRKGRWFGRTWASTLDQRVEIDADGIHYAAPDGVVLHYPVPIQPGQAVLPSAGARWPLTWDQATDSILIEQPELGRRLEFPGGGGLGRRRLWRSLATVVDRNGNQVLFVYDEYGVPTDVYHSGGYHVLVESIGTGAGVRVSGLRLAGSGGGSDVGALIVSFGYDALGRLTDVVNSSGQPLVFAYDRQDRITSWTDRNGYSYEYHYDVDGRVVRAAGTDGYLSASFAYDVSARTTTLTDALGYDTVYHWNDRNQVYKIIDPLGAETLTERDEFGRLLSRTDPLGRTTTYTVNEHGEPTRVEQPDGTAAQIEYATAHLPARVIGPDGAAWNFAYDERGNVCSTTDPLGATTTYTYGDRGALLAAVDPLGNATTYTCDPAGLPLSVTDPTGVTLSLARDEFGRVSSWTDSAGAVTTLGWTAEGRPAWRVHPDGAREQWAYDPEGNLLAHTNAIGGVTAFEYGPFNRTLARTDPSGARYEFGYDPRLRLTAVTNPQALTWRYDFDPADHLLAETDFNGRSLGYEYDVAGQLIRRTNGAGQSVEFVRDACGRMVQRRAVGMAAESATVFRYDEAGRLIGAQSPDGGLEFGRDALGRIVAETFDGRALTREFDPAGRLVRRGTPGAGLSEWAYDRAGRTTSLVTHGGGLGFEYDQAGREVSRALGPLAVLSQAFDAVGRLAAQGVWTIDQPGATTEPRLIQQRAYEYRPDGALVRVSDQLRGLRMMDVDPIGRVTAVTAATWRETYTYDAMGNLAMAEQPGHQDTAGVREYHGGLIARAGRTVYEHDAQGRVVRTIRRTLSGQTREASFAWDADDRLIRATTPDGHIWSYAYDPLGRRVAKRRLGEDGAVLDQVWFTWDGTQLAEQISTGPDARAIAMTWDYDPVTGRPAAQTRRSWATDAEQSQIDVEFHAIVTDLVGTPQELVAGDGRIAWWQTTSLWGKTIDAPDSTARCPLRFPGQYHDDETGLDYNYHRYYDPELGRYGSPDLLGLLGGLNPHAYVPNPLRQRDRLGLTCDDPFADRPDLAGKTVAVMGRLPDTEVAKTWPGHEVLDVPKWSIAVNDDWVDSVVSRGMPVYVGSPLSYENLWDAANDRPTVTARELRMFQDAGYEWQGYYLLPPAPTGTS